MKLATTKKAAAPAKKKKAAAKPAPPFGMLTSHGLRLMTSHGFHLLTSHGFPIASGDKTIRLPKARGLRVEVKASGIYLHFEEE